MRKIILSVMVSLDGFIEDQERKIDWHTWDVDMDEYMSNFFKGIDTIILGRVAYELMADYWPTSAAESENSLIAHKMNKLKKLVYSQSLSSAEWRNTELNKELRKQDILELKKNGEKDIVIFGGAKIAQVFINEDLIDEYRLIVNPIILGRGKPLFESGFQLNKKLKLEKAIANASGNVILCYTKSTS